MVQEIEETTAITLLNGWWNFVSYNIVGNKWQLLADYSKSTHKMNRKTGYSTGP